MSNTLPLRGEASSEFDQYDEMTDTDIDAKLKLHEEFLAEINSLISSIPQEQPERKRAIPDITDRLVNLVDARTEEIRTKRQQPTGQFHFLRQAFEEASTLERGRTVRGPLHPQINALLGRCTTLLTAIDPNLPPDVLAPWGYKSKKTQHMMNWHSRSFWYRGVKYLEQAKRDALDDLSEQNLAELMSQELPEEVLGAPDYIKQVGERACMTACVQMVMETIYGQEFNDRAFQGAIYDVHHSDILDDEHLINLVHTRAFKEQFTKDVYTFDFLGADFSFITKLATDIRERMPAKPVYCIVTLLSDSSEATRELGIWHANILLSADQDTVTVHDPKKGANLVIPKDDFIMRWGQSYMRGHIIVG